MAEIIAASYEERRPAEIMVCAQNPDFEKEKCERAAPLENESSPVKENIVNWKSLNQEEFICDNRLEQVEKKNAKLLHQISSLSELSEQATRKHNVEIQNLTESLCKTRQAMANQKKKYEDSIGRLKDELKGVNDKVFQLQPYKQDLTTTAANSKYTAFCESVKVWVDRLLDPILDNKDCFESIRRAVRNDPNLFAPFRKTMRESDFKAMTFEDADTHLVVAFIMRVLQQEVWGDDVSILPDEAVEILWVTEKSMKSLVPKRGKFDLTYMLLADEWEKLIKETEFSTIRAWRNESYLALLNTEEVRNWKNRKIDHITHRLTNFLKVFIDQCAPSEFNSFFASIRSGIVEPAISFDEEIKLDTHLYFFDDRADIQNASDQSKSLIDSIDELECSNILEKGRRFGRANIKCKIQDTDGRVIGHSVQYLCTTMPALLRKEVQGDSVQSPSILKKAQVQIAFRNAADPNLNASNRTGLIASLVQIIETQRGFFPFWFRGSLPIFKPLKRLQ